MHHPTRVTNGAVKAKGDQAAVPSQAYWAAVCVGCVVLLVATLLAAPDVTWLDSAEFVAASWGLGVAHPPGHPLPLLAGRLVSLVPFGGIAFRMNLASAIQLALAAGLLTVLFWAVLDTVLRVWLPILDERMRTVICVAVAAASALTAATSGTALMQGVRTEVYALHFLVSVCVLLGLVCWWRTGRHSHLYASGFALGLALSNHHLLALALTGAVALCWVRLFAQSGSKGGVRLVVWAGWVGLGLAVLCYLPLRAAADPLVNWGHPDSFGRFAWTLSAKIFFKTASRVAAESVGGRLALLVAEVAVQLGVAVALLSLAGAYLGMRKLGSAGMVSVVLLAGIGTAAAATLGAFDPKNPDSHGYLLVCLLSAALCGSVALALAVGYLSAAGPGPPGVWRRLAVVGAACTLLWPAFRAGQAVTAADRRTDWGAFEVGRAVLDLLPPRSVFLMGYHETVFATWYQAVVCGARPDVALIYRHHLTLPGRAAQLGRRWPSLAPLLVGVRRTGKAGWLDPELLGGLSRVRPVVLEPDNHPLDPFPLSLLASVEPFGPVVWLFGRGYGVSGNTDRAAWSQLRAALESQQYEDGTRRFLLWRYYQSAWLSLVTGRCSSGLWAYLRALELAPQDPLLISLGKRCGFGAARTP